MDKGKRLGAYYATPAHKKRRRRRQRPTASASRLRRRGKRNKRLHKPSR